MTKVFKVPGRQNLRILGGIVKETATNKSKTEFISLLVYEDFAGEYSGIVNCSPAKATYSRRDGQGNSDKQV